MSVVALSLGALTLTGCAAPDDALDGAEDEEQLVEEEDETLEARVVGTSRDTSPRSHSGTPRVGSVTRTVDPGSSSRSGVGKATRTTHDVGSTSARSSTGRTVHDMGTSSSGRTVRFGGIVRR